MENHTSAADKKAGIGLIFESTRPGNTGLAVSSIPPGGPAHACGKIEVGDFLVAVNDHNVEAFDPQRIAPYILGPQVGPRVPLLFFIGIHASRWATRSYMRLVAPSVGTTAHCNSLLHPPLPLSAPSFLPFRLPRGAETLHGIGNRPSTCALFLAGDRGQAGPSDEGRQKQGCDS